MYINNKILVGKNQNYDAYLLLNKLNRHGLITGASGSGKTITLKVLAEGFAEANVPVFLVDVKGDLAGMVNYGNQETIQGRLDKLNITDFTVRNFKSVSFNYPAEMNKPVLPAVTIWRGKPNKKPKQTIVFGEPIYPNPELSLMENKAYLHEQCLEQMKEISERYPQVEYIKYIKKD